MLSVVGLFDDDAFLTNMRNEFWSFLLDFTFLSENKSTCGKFLVYSILKKRLPKQSVIVATNWLKREITFTSPSHVLKFN